MSLPNKYPKRTTFYDPRGHQLWDQELDRTKTVLEYRKDPKTRSAEILINNPTKLNYIDRADYFEMHRIMDEIEADDDVKSVVLRGAGPCLSTGYSMAALGFVHGIQRNLPGERRAPQRTRLPTDRWYFGGGGWLDRWNYLPKFTICEAKSYCIGVTMWLAMAADFTIASEDAVFGHPAFRWVGASVDANLGQAIMVLGPKRARKLTMLGSYLEAQQALQAGLVTEVVPRSSLEKRVAEYVEACSLQPIDGIATTKHAFEVAEAALGLKTARTMGAVMHAVNSNIRFEPDEWSFFRDRRDRGFKDSMAERERRWEKIPGFAFPFRPHEYSTTRTHIAGKQYRPFGPKKAVTSGGEKPASSA